MKTQLKLACCCAALVVGAACSRSNNLLFGEVRATVGTHPVTVTDCYQTSVPQPEKLADGYRYAPCRDAVVVLRGENLSVNGQNYGPIGADDPILVDHGVVSISGRKALVVASR